MILISALPLVLSLLAPGRADAPTAPLSQERSALDLSGLDGLVPVQIITFNPDEINRLTAGDQPGSVLRMVPGVVHRPGGTFLGGVPLSQCAVMLDGVVLLSDTFPAW